MTKMIESKKTWRTGFYIFSQKALIRGACKSNRTPANDTELISNQSSATQEEKEIQNENSK